LGRALERHDDEIVGVAELRLPEPPVDREHQVDGVEPPLLPDLRTVGAERETEAEDDATTDRGGATANRLGRDEIDGAALVVRSPAAPVGDLA